jgi:YidC/Oxa1 family membrane protein insertase
MNIFDTFLVIPITNLLVALYLGLTTLGIPYALGFAIILLTVSIRLLLAPITASQLRMSKKMQEINPHLSALKAKHKDDPKLLQSETMRLYAEHGVNPLAGCLPTILQMVVLFGLYAVLNQIAKDPQTALTHINSVVYFPWLKLSHVWDATFFGLPLVKKPADLLASVGPLILLIPVVTGLAQFIQSAMMFTAPQAAPTKAPKKTADKEPAVDFTAAMQSNTMYILPVMIGYFSFTFPLALALYWNTFTIFGIIQQYRIGGWGRLADWKQKLLPAKQ